jgi:hypothetical protein
MKVYAMGLGKSRDSSEIRTKWYNWFNENIPEFGKLKGIWKGVPYTGNPWPDIHKELSDLRCLSDEILESVSIIHKWGGDGGVFYYFATREVIANTFAGLHYHLIANFEDDTTAVLFRLMMT